MQKQAGQAAAESDKVLPEERQNQTDDDRHAHGD